jgi:hypothetical protein
VAKKGAATRKRKVSSAAPRATPKRRATSSKHDDPSEEGSVARPVGQGSDDDLVIEVCQRQCAFNWLRDNRQLQCDRCIEAGVHCEVRPTASCQRCGDKKLGCTLVPSRDSGKPDRRAVSAEKLYRWRMDMMREKRDNTARRNSSKEEPSAVKKGKQRARDSDDPVESEGSAPAPSPVTALAALGNMVLDSGGSSAANTPGDSPAALPQPPLPEGYTSAPPQDPKTYGASGSFGGMSTFELRVAALSIFDRDDT